MTYINTMGYQKRGFLRIQYTISR